MKVLKLNRDEEDAEEGRAKVLAARQREREETRAQVGRDWKVKVKRQGEGRDLCLFPIVILD